MNRDTQNFVANPGLGWMFYNATTPQGFGLWNGSLTTFEAHESGEAKSIALQCVAIKAPRDASKIELKAHEKSGGDRYEIKLVEKGLNGDAWKHRGEFTLPAFGERRSQVVKTPLGNLQAWLQAPRNNIGWCIRFRMLRDNNGVVRASRPM